MTVVGKTLGRPKMKWEDNIKMDLKYNYKNRRLIRVYEGRVQRRTWAVTFILFMRRCNLLVILSVTQTTQRLEILG